MNKTPLKRTKGINPISLRKVLQLQDEVPERIALCHRAKGTPILGKHTYYIKGKAYSIDTVQCWGGICECGCGERTYGVLEPHEDPPRSRGGKVSLKDSIMVKPEHHRKLQNNEPIWSKRESQ